MTARTEVITFHYYPRFRQSNNIFFLFLRHHFIISRFLSIFFLKGGAGNCLRRERRDVEADLFSLSVFSPPCYILVQEVTIH